MKRPILNFLAIFLVSMMLSCAGSQRHSAQTYPLLPNDCWLSQTAIYRLRHSAKLEYKDKQEILEGFMELDLKRCRAHLAIFNNLGLTLLNIKIEPDRYQLVETSTGTEKEVARNKREQLFASAVASAVQHIFFSLKSCQKHQQSGDQQPHSEFSGTPPKLTKISEKQPDPTWSVTYHDYQKGVAGWLPERIILENLRPAYRLTIWLHKAELKKEKSR